MSYQRAARLLDNVSSNVTGDAFQMAAGLYSIHIWATGPGDDGFGGGNIFFETNVLDPTDADAWVPVSNLDAVLYQFGTKVTLDWDKIAHGAWVRAIITGSTGASGVNVQISRVPT